MDPLAGIVREALIVTATLCLPVLLVATLVGTAVAVVQAATQVQEQTLTLLPKLLAVAAICAIGGGYGMTRCAALFTDAIATLPAIVRGE